MSELDEVQQAAYIADNRKHKLGDQLNLLLPTTRQARIATGYFYSNAFRHLVPDAPALERKGGVKIILGKETDRITKLVAEAGSEDHKGGVVRDIRQAIHGLGISPDNADYLSELYRAIQEGRIEMKAYKDGIFHPKAYILHQTHAVGNVAYVGSSNMTAPGLMSNLELNVQAHGPVFDELVKWFDELFDGESVEDIAADVLEAIDSSPNVQVTKGELVDYVQPWEALLGVASYFLTRKTLERSEFMADFQETGVRNATLKIEQFGGCLIADSVGLGKSFTGAGVLKDYWEKGRNCLCIVPAHIVDQWKALLEIDAPPSKPDTPFFGMKVDGMRLEVLSQGVLQNMEPEDFAEAYRDFDVILVDESHRYRNHETKGYTSLRALKNVKPKKDQDEKRFIFLSATPINNSVKDVRNQLDLCLQETKVRSLLGQGFSVFDKYMELRAKRDRADENPGKTKFTERDDVTLKWARETIIRILSNALILRTREFLQQNHPEGVIEVGGAKLQFKRPLVSQHVYEFNHPHIRRLIHRVPDLMEDLHAPHITILNPKAGEILRGIYKSHLLKRLESSIHAFHQSLLNYLRSLDNLEATLKGAEDLEEARKKFRAKKNRGIMDLEEEGIDMDVEDRHDDDRTLEDFLQEISTDRKIIEGVIAEHFEGKSGLRQDHAIFQYHDDKIKDLIAYLKRQGNEKVLLFTQYADTADYLFSTLCDFVKREGLLRGIRVGLSTGSTHRHITLGETSRTDNAWLFSPKSNARKRSDGSEISPGDDELTVLIATDALSEGANLQDCNVIANYDLPWNPTRLIQRVGRIDRIVRSGELQQNYVTNFVAPQILEENLRLLDALQKRSKLIADFMAKEFGILSEDEETSARSYGHERDDDRYNQVRQKIRSLGSAGITELEKQGTSSLLRDAAMDMGMGLIELEFEDYLRKFDVTHGDLIAAQELFPVTQKPRLAVQRDAGARGAWVYARTRLARRMESVRRHYLLWYDANMGQVLDLAPDSLKITPETPGFAITDENQEQVRGMIQPLMDYLKEVHGKEQREAAGLVANTKRKPGVKVQYIQGLYRKTNTSMQAAQKKRGLGTGPVPEEAAKAFKEAAKWYIGAEFQAAEEKALVALLEEKHGDRWQKMQYMDLHETLIQFMKETKSGSARYRGPELTAEDVKMDIIVGGVLLD